MTFNDFEFERRNSPYFAFFLPNSIALQAAYVTVAEDRPITSVKYCLPVLVIHFWPNLAHHALFLQYFMLFLVVTSTV